MSQPGRSTTASLLPGGRADAGGLRSMIDWAELARRGWDSDGEVFAPACDDPVFGVGWCATANCEQVVHHPGLGLCRRCQQLWEQSPPAVSFEEFCRAAPARTKPQGGGLCLVCRTPGHERPVRGRGLCTACAAAARDRGQTVAAYIAGDSRFPPAMPRPDLRGVRRRRMCPVGASRRARPVRGARARLGRRGPPDGCIVAGVVRPGPGARCRQPGSGAQRLGRPGPARGPLRAALRSPG